MSKGHSCDVCGNWFAEISQRQKEHMEKLQAMDDDAVLPEICDDCHDKFILWFLILGEEKMKEMLKLHMRKKDGD